MRGCDAVADGLLELLNFREAAGLGARPDDFGVNPYLEDATCARHQRQLANFPGKRGQKLLGYPAGAKQPPALCAVLDLDPRSFEHACCAVYLCGRA